MQLLAMHPENKAKLEIFINKTLTPNLLRLALQIYCHPEIPTDWNSAFTYNITRYALTPFFKTLYEIIINTDSADFDKEVPPSIARTVEAHIARSNDNMACDITHAINKTKTIRELSVQPMEIEGENIFDHMRTALKNLDNISQDTCADGNIVIDCLEKLSDPDYLAQVEKAKQEQINQEADLDPFWIETPFSHDGIPFHIEAYQTVQQLKDAITNLTSSFITIFRLAESKNRLPEFFEQLWGLCLEGRTRKALKWGGSLLDREVDDLEAIFNARLYRQAQEFLTATKQPLNFVNLISFLQICIGRMYQKEDGTLKRVQVEECEKYVSQDLWHERNDPPETKTNTLIDALKSGSLVEVQHNLVENQPIASQDEISALVFAVWQDFLLNQEGALSKALLKQGVTNLKYVPSLEAINYAVLHLVHHYPQHPAVVSAILHYIQVIQPQYVDNINSNYYFLNTQTNILHLAAQHFKYNPPFFKNIFSNLFLDWHKTNSEIFSENNISPVVVAVQYGQVAAYLFLTKLLYKKYGDEYLEKFHRDHHLLDEAINASNSDLADLIVSSYPSLINTGSEFKALSLAAELGNADMCNWLLVIVSIHGMLRQFTSPAPLIKAIKARQPEVIPIILGMYQEYFSLEVFRFALATRNPNVCHALLDALESTNRLDLLTISNNEQLKFTLLIEATQPDDEKLISRLYTLIPSLIPKGDSRFPGGMAQIEGAFTPLTIFSFAASAALTESLIQVLGNSPRIYLPAHIARLQYLEWNIFGEVYLNPLHLAIYRYRLDTIEILIKYNPALYNTTFFNGMTPLQFAVTRGDFELTEILLKGGQYNRSHIREFSDPFFLKYHSTSYHTTHEAPLNIAIRNKNNRIINSIIKYCRPSIMDCFTACNDIDVLIHIFSELDWRVTGLCQYEANLYKDEGNVLHVLFYYANNNWIRDDGGFKFYGLINRIMELNPELLNEVNSKGLKPIHYLHRCNYSMFNEVVQMTHQTHFDGFFFRNLLQHKAVNRDLIFRLLSLHPQMLRLVPDYLKLICDLPTVSATNLCKIRRIGILLNVELNFTSPENSERLNVLHFAIIANYKHSREKDFFTILYKMARERDPSLLQAKTRLGISVLMLALVAFVSKPTQGTLNPFIFLLNEMKELNQEIDLSFPIANSPDINFYHELGISFIQQYLGLSALHIIMLNDGHSKVLSIALAEILKINPQGLYALDCNGDTPLHYMVRSNALRDDNRWQEMARYAIPLGIALATKNANEQSPLGIIASRNYTAGLSFFSFAPGGQQSNERVELASGENMTLGAWFNRQSQSRRAQRHHPSQTIATLFVPNMTVTINQQENPAEALIANAVALEAIVFRNRFFPAAPEQLNAIDTQDMHFSPH